MAQRFARFGVVIGMLLGVAGDVATCVAWTSETDAAAMGIEEPSERVQAVGYRSVKFKEGSFWGERLDAIRRGTLKANRHQCEITGRLTNFDRAAAKIRGEKDSGEFQGLLFNDSDVYKMVEGWCYLVAMTEDAAERATLEKDLDGLIARIAAAQYPDGYINTYFTLKKGVENRLTDERNDHETYCIGHLIEAGVAHYQATGKRTLLDVAIRAADFVCDVYGKGFSVPPGHQEVELALIRLQDALPKEAAQGGKYVAMAEKLIELRGRPRRTLDGKERPTAGEYAQDHLPAAEQMEAAGHAVRAAYMYCAMTDLAVRGKGAYVLALDSLWDDITGRRMFVTGGIGPSAHNEGFTTPYDIPTHSAYQETCASIGVCLWAQRMFELHGEAKYFDQFERTLFNAALAGVSLDGEKFFYVNPLASRGSEARRDWFSCACCPPNVLRFFGLLSGQCYAVRGSTLYVNLFASSTMECVVDGQAVRIEQETEYPYDGAVKLKIKHGGTRPITLAIRCPEGQRVEGLPEGADDGYAGLEIRPGVQEIEFKLPMDVRRVYADPRAKQLAGMTAIMRGPLVYATEIVRDANQRTQTQEDLSRVALSGVDEPKVVVGSDGVPELVIRAAEFGGATLTQRDDVLYQAGPDGKQIEMRMRPYFTWANQGSARMAVWFAEGVSALPRSLGMEITASHVWSRDSAEAAADVQEPASSGDQSIPRLTFWPHKGTEEWVEAKFLNSRNVKSVSVYWFDDGGSGACRIPAEWSIQIRGADGKWVDVAGDSAAAGKKDGWDMRSIQPVQTQGIRLRIKLREGYSAGILEMKVN
ncbi:MAG: glycoside hydrolase family 127 protein [Planctomycetes bacterium]|nr:glycoside hydrolase family 127 protein [Planctomycetota bacterium]